MRKKRKRALLLTPLTGEFVEGALHDGIKGGAEIMQPFFSSFYAS